MARMVPLFNSRWMNVEIMSAVLSGRIMGLERVKVKGSNSMCGRRSYNPLALVNVGGQNSLVVGSTQCIKQQNTLFSSSDARLTHDFEKSDARCSKNDSSSAEGLRFFTTNVTVNLNHQIVKLDVQELQVLNQSDLSPKSEEQQNDGFTGLVTPAVQESLTDASAEAKEILVASVEVSVVGNVEEDVEPISKHDTPADEGKWWHIPDSIVEVLALPDDFEERLEVLFRSFGSQIDSRELLLRVLVHKSYYDQKVPAIIKDREYMKPPTPLFINSGEVKQQYVEGLPSKTISCMMFGDAHGEVRSQLAILGDGVIGLAVSSLLVHQHSSAGTITERKCQLVSLITKTIPKLVQQGVSNSNLSRVWRTLLGPGDFVLSFGESSSQPAAQSRMMADSCEAYIGALYAEKGFETAYNCVTNALLPLLVQADSVRNPVHALNLHSSMIFQVLPEYRLVGIDNEFTQHQVCRVRVYVKGMRMATGMGGNQKLARVDAARKALEKWPTVFRVVRD